MTPQDIIAEFERREAVEGSDPNTHPMEIAHSIAREYGLSWPAIRDVLSDHFTYVGAEK